ncbi:hypothetical protein PFLUV_G00073490 [Perca fluviatilis]|uniref:Uncharacterized protein n=1 Tax=Perca fluviatilis TaxID=8168 RepID=A0A6A5FHA4_PERFL|nr:hypothetical protein PFLUV_G00073490 [Perca fluviatilis]
MSQPCNTTRPVQRHFLSRASCITDTLPLWSYLLCPLLRLWSPYCFMITNLGMLASLCDSCHGDKRIPLVDHFRHNLQMLCQMQVVHTGRIGQGQAHRCCAAQLPNSHCLTTSQQEV